MVSTAVVPDTTEGWESIMKNLREEAFPSPWRSDFKGKENWFLKAIHRLIEMEDMMRFEKNSCIPYVARGTYDDVMGQGVPDYSNCKNIVLQEKSKNMVTVFEDMLSHIFNNMNDVLSPMFMPNVAPPISTCSIAAVLIGSKLNPNILDEHYALNVVKAELEVASMVISTLPIGTGDGEWLKPWSPPAPEITDYYKVLGVPESGVGSGGISTFGGTGCYLYAIKYALTRTANSVLDDGQTIRATGFDRGKFVIVVSDQGHYCVKNVTDWSGIGYDNVVRVKTNKDNTMDLEDLREKLNYCKSKGKVVAAVVATFGTTDAGALDDVAGVRAVIRGFDNIVDPQTDRRYRKPLLYADAVSAWILLFWRDYNYEHNPLNFDPALLALAKVNSDRAGGLAYADAFGVDFHKTGYSAYPASMILFKDYGEFATLMKRDAPAYLQQEQYDPALYTLETSRGCNGAVAAWATLRHFGRFGICSLSCNLLELQQYFREKFIKTGVAVICNESNYFYSTLVRVYPYSVTRDDYERELTEEDGYMRFKAVNEFQRAIYNNLYKHLRKNDGSTGRMSTPNLGLTTGFRYTYYNADGEKREPNGTDPMQGVFALKCYFNNPFTEQEHVESTINHICAARLEVMLNYLQKSVKIDIRQLPPRIRREVRKDIHVHHNMIPAKLISHHYLLPRKFSYAQDPHLVGYIQKLQEEKDVVDKMKKF